MSKQSKRTEWIENLRINSFEIEILLVGFVLILLFQSPDLYGSFSNSINKFDFNNINSLVKAAPLILIIASLMIITRILIITFVLYLVSRGIWISVIGLSSVYIDGINIQKLNYYSRYKSIILKLDFDKFTKKN